MEGDKDFYTGAMYGVIDAVASGGLNMQRDDHERWDPHADNLPDALIGTGHDPFVKLLLSGDPSNTAVTEVVYGYFRSGQLDKAVGIVKQYPHKTHGFDLNYLADALIDSGANDQLILDFAECLKQKKQNGFSEYDSVYYILRNLTKSLWKVGRFDLSKTIIEGFLDEWERPCMLIVERLVKGEKVDVEEIYQAVEAFCPLDLRKLEDGERRYNFEASDNTDKLQKFILSLDEAKASIDLLKAAFEAYLKRKETGQMGHISDVRTIEKKIRKDMLDRGDFEGAQEFAKKESMGDWTELEVIAARITHASKNGDIATHKKALDRYVQIKEEGMQRIVEAKQKAEEEERAAKEGQGEVVGEGEIVIEQSWSTRIHSLELSAKKDQELSIFELRHGTVESAQPYIDRMIETVEKIAVPVREGGFRKHLNTLRARSRSLKRSIRERFLELGMLESLPAKNYWNKPIFVMMEQKLERRRESRAKRDESRETRMSGNEASNMAYWKKEAENEKAIQDELRGVLVEKGPDEAIKFLASKISYYALTRDWNRGMIILEAAPDRFELLVKLLTKDYFVTSHDHKYKGSFDGMAAFYVAGRRLGVVDETKFNDLIEKWKANCSVYDSKRSLTRPGVMGLVEGLLNDGAWEEALVYFKKLQATGKMSRATMVECLSLFIKVASEKIGEVMTGVAAAFKGQNLEEGYSVSEEIEYWNSQIEMLLAAKDEEGYSVAYGELVQRIDNPEGVRVLTRLMALGSIRTPHQKKSVLTAAYDLNKASQETRYELVAAMIDHGIPGAEAMPEVKSKETPTEVAIMLFGKLIKKGILHAHTAKYLDEENLPYLRRLLSQYQNHFNTVMEVLSGDFTQGSFDDGEEYDEVFDEDGDDEVGLDEDTLMALKRELSGGVKKEDTPSNLWEGVLKTLAEVGVFTPGIYAEAKACKFNKTGLKKIEEKFTKLKKDIFSNRPIDPEATPQLVAELVCITYQPANMSFQQVVSLCRSVQDCSHHLDKYKFPEDGYSLDLTTSKTMKLRDRLRLDTPRVVYQEPPVVEHPGEGHLGLKETNPYLDRVRALCKFARLKFEEVNVSDLLVVLGDDGFMQGAFEAFGMAKDDDGKYRGLRLMQEALGVYLADNLEGAIIEFLRKNKSAISNTLENLVSGFKNPGKRKFLKEQFDIELDESKSNIKLAAQIIAQVALQKFKPLKDLRKTIAGDLKKFVSEEGEEVMGNNVKIRAIVSKNKASFFAKASAGICTANNTELFHREDHFHINLVDDEKGKCVGNVQAYIMEHEGRPHLLLRGFNPSTNLLKEVDAGSLCESIIAIAQQFADENGLAGVLLSEQGGFLALSNRPEVTTYIQNAYKEKAVEVKEFNIAGGYTIKAAYAVGASRRGRPSAHLRKRMDRQNENGVSMVA